MDTTLTLLKINLKRAIISKSFILSAVGTAVLILAGSSSTIFALDFYGNFVLTGDILSGLTSGLMGSSGTPFAIIGILPLFVFATSFATEWNHRATNFWMIRVNVKKYAICKIIVTALTAVLMTFSGFLLYTVVLSFWVPFFSMFQTGDSFEPFILAGRPVLYFIYFTLYYSLGSALWAVTGLGISTLIPDKFTIIASPLVLYFLMEQLLTSPNIPEFLLPVNFVQGIHQGSTPHSTLFSKFAVVFILCTLIGIGTTFQMKRRIQNG